MKTYRPHLLVVILLSVLVLSGQHLRLREALLDARFGWLTRPASGDIVLVEIDPRSIEAVGRWPWPRRLHADLVQKLEAAGASDIVFDIDFSSPSTPEEDAAFAAALTAAGGSVVLPAFRQRVADRGDGRTLHVNRPLPAFASQAWLGLVNVMPDGDGIIRSYDHGAVIDGEFVPSIGALLAGRHDRNAPPFRIDFGILPGSVPSLSFIDVLRGDPSVAAKLRGKRVIVSGTAAELGDRFTVPNGRIIPGSMIQALAGESILQGRALTVTSRAVALACLAGLIGAMMLAWGRSRVGVRVAALAMVASGAEVLALAVQWRYPVAIDTSLVIAAALIYAVVAAIDEIDLRGLLTVVAERRFQRIAMSLSDGLICVDRDGLIRLWNPGARVIFGHDEKEALGRPFEWLLAGAPHGEVPFALLSVSADRLQQPGGLVVELIGARRSGEAFDLECSLSSWDSGSGVQFGVVMRDISLRKRQQERIRYLAECDTVTGLPNRNSVIAHLDAVMRGRAVPEMAVMLVGINRFQQVNDLYGESFGDALIVAIAARLRETATEAEMIGRLGSDEFAILLAGGAAVAQRLGEVLAQSFQAWPVFVGEGQHRISVAIGIAPTENAASAEELIGNGHFALASAKARGGAGAVRFDPAMRTALERREALESELRQALARDEFELFYQPQIDLRTRAVIGAEALIRWRHPQRGYVSPGEFMPVVNTTSLSDGVAAWVMATACRQAASWQRAGHEIRIGVNLSQSQFASGDLAADVERLLRENDLRPDLLELEVTEDIILDNGGATQRMLAAIRSLGVKIAFDDFGTGYGSLTYLKAFPLDTLKIDQSFVKTLQPGTEDAAIVVATIDLGHALGLSVIAEGIENEETAKLLYAMGCDEGQGYLISRPVPADAFRRDHLDSALARVA